MPSKKRYRPRPVALDTMALALSGAAKPHPDDIHQVLAGVHTAWTALRQGRASEVQWSVLAGSLAVALAIERQGVVRGLTEHLANTETALQTVYDRARRAGIWSSPTLYSCEIEAIHTFVDLHAFQIKQLGRAEFLKAVDLAQAQITSNGGRVTIVREIERLAA